MTISETILLNFGYNCWKTEETRKHWQKRFDDESGVKYFINIIQSKDWNEGMEDNYWPSIQFDIPVKDLFQNVSVELVQWLNEAGKYSNLTVQDIEDACESIWKRLDGQYYEKWTEKH